MFKGKTSKGAEVSGTYGFNEVPVGRTWILVANRTGAKLFERIGPNEALEFPREFPCPEGRVRDGECHQDQQPGRAFNSSGQSHGGHGTSNPRHALGSDVTPHELSARRFSSHLAAMLEKGRTEHRYTQLVLVSEPKFLGMLRDALSPQVKERITVTLEKDIEEMPNHTLGEHLLDLLKI